MRNLSRRLRRLQATFTDATGLVPESPAWFEHWREQIRRVLAESDYCPRPRTPLDVFRSYLWQEE